MKFTSGARIKWRRGYDQRAVPIGLVPIMVDPGLFEFKAQDKPFDETNSLRFKLHVICTKKDPKMQTPLNISDADEEERIFNHSNVYSGDLEWIPIGDQA